MSWNDEAENILAALVQMVPETLRELAEGATREESEEAASARGAQSVSADDVIRAWIRTTPPEQRDSLIAVIESLGFEPELYVEELGSVEGWEETED
ncbi:MAG: DUF2621 domain-containing protein [Chloroflexota bacterium]|nr:DUF2621 domain-containing protein [Chloroflexota bacterium]